MCTDPAKYLCSGLRLKFPPCNSQSELVRAAFRPAMDTAPITDLPARRAMGHVEVGAAGGHVGNPGGPPAERLPSGAERRADPAGLYYRGECLRRGGRRAASAWVLLAIPTSHSNLVLILPMESSLTPSLPKQILIEACFRASFVGSK